MLITRANKILLSFGILFFAVGISIFAYLLVPYLKETVGLKSTGYRTQGIVLLIESQLQNDTPINKRSKNYSGSVATYQPVVSFIDNLGKEHVFESRTGSSNSRYKPGDVVTVLYDSKNPNRARIDGFLENWLGVIIFSLLSLAFLGVGGGVAYYHIKKIILRMLLLKNGKKVRGVVGKICLNQNRRINNKQPYIIWCTFLDNNTGSAYEFRSDDIRNDPKDFVKKGDSIDIFINPSDYNNYFIDLSFLPRKIVNGEPQ